MRTPFAAAMLAAAFALPLAARAAAPMQIKFAVPSPPVGTIYQGLAGYAADVNKDADGAVDVKVYAGFSLANFANAYDRTINGVVGMAWSIIGPISSEFPKTNVVTLPFETDSGPIAAQALWNLYADGMIASEYKKVHLLGFVVFPNISLHSNKPIRTMADLAGLKISAEGRVLTHTLANLGATPITMAVTQIYQSLQRSLVDATAIAWPAILTFKLDDVTTDHLDVSLGNDDGFIIMNNGSYARLPAKAKAAIDKLSGAALCARMERAVDAVTRAAEAHSASLPGKKIMKLAPDEAARWKAKVEPSVAEWEKSTPDGAGVLAAFRAQIAKLSAK